MINADSSLSVFPSLSASDPSQPKSTLLLQQANWLAPARSRLLRRIGIAHRKRILDLGAGYGSASFELGQRSSGYVLAFDRRYNSLCEIDSAEVALRIVGDAARLPWPDHSFDLVFCQVGLLWMTPTQKIIEEVWRILENGGVFVSLEPDFNSLIEYPPEMAAKDLWISALNRAGANLEACRMVPSILETLGFKVRIDLLERIHSPSPFRFEFFRELPLTNDERSQVDRLELLSGEMPGWSQIVHLPFFLTTAEKP